MVLLPDVEVIRNYRPDFLRNPLTGRNLEIDFYLPESKIGMEIQGQHHITDTIQQGRDDYKRDVCQSLGVYILEFCISQIGPVVIRKKLMGISLSTRRKIGLREFDPNWICIAKEIRETYVKVLREKFPESYCNKSCKTQRRLMGAVRYKRKMVATSFDDLTLSPLGEPQILVR